MSCIITTICNITKDSPGVLCPSHPYSPEEHSYQIFAIGEEGEKEERVAPDMAHLRVVLAMINSVGEEEVLLDSGLQIVLMTKKVAAANKASWDPSLSI